MRADARTLGGAPVKGNATNDAIIPVDNSDSWIVGSDQMDRISTDDPRNVRAFFNKVKGAFRAGRTGYVGPANWDDANVGIDSFATGLNTRASGVQSFAEGESSSATGAKSAAFNNFTSATGANSHAEGDSTTASGQSSHAEGTSTTASGHSTHAEGHSTTASDTGAHAEGVSTTASGYASHAAGKDALAPRALQKSHSGGKFVANGDAQHCEMSLRGITSNNTPYALRTNNVGSSQPITLTGVQTNVLTITASRAYKLKIEAVARRTDAQGEMAGFSWDGLVGRDSTGSARIIGTPTEAAWGDTPATDAWVLAVSINTTDATDNYVAVTVTGETGKTIRWVAKAEWVEVAG